MIARTGSPAFRVAGPVEETNATGTGRCDTHPQAACEFRVVAGGEGRGFFASDLDEANLLFVSAKRSEDSVNGIPREPENYFAIPLSQSFGQQVRYGFRHQKPSLPSARFPPWLVGQQ